MDTNSKNTNVADEEQVFSLRDFLTLCLANWQWFVVSLIICIGFGAFMVMRQEPVYRRTISVLIKDDNSANPSDMGNSFSGFNLFGGNKNVQNELISLTSPAVITEVVKRLDLTTNYAQTGKFHPTTLYRDNNPVNVSFPDLDPQKSVGFSIELQPNGSIRLYDFWKFNDEGKKEKFENEYNSRLSFNFIKTPIGRINVQPNGGFLGKITEPVEIKVSHSGLQATIEMYSQKLKGDLANQDAEVIDLTIDDVCIQRANDILNNTVLVYNEQWVEDKNRLAVATTDFISERLAVIERELGNVDNDISDFKSRNRVPDIKSTVEMKLQESATVNSEAIRVRNQLAMASFIRDFIRNPQNKYSVIPANVGLEHLSVEDAVKNYNNLLLQRDNLLANSGPNNPVIKEMDRTIDGMRESIIGALTSVMGQLQAGLRDMEANQSANDSELAAAPVQAKYLLSIERQQKVKEELYVFLLQKREENELSQTFTAYNTRIITPPFGPMAPVAPKKMLILAISFILGLAIPGVIFYVIEATNTKIRSRRDLENLQVPFAGEIPLIGKKHRIRNLFKSGRKRKAEKEAPKPVVEEGKRDVPNEAFRVVRSNIDFMLGKDSGCAVIMLTSFNPGSGKSFIAYNLGASFALKRKRVLIIDCDLRHGSLSTYAGSPKKGLSNYLTGNTNNWEALVVKGVGAPTLDIMPIGHRPPNPAELLENGRLGELLYSARQEYDIILIDCPPVNIVVDTQIVEEYVDRTLFVIRAGLLERSAVPEVTELYTDKKFKHMSILLNGTQATYSTYYHYGNYQSIEDD